MGVKYIFTSDNGKIKREVVDPNKCIHATYTDKPIKGCKTCGKNRWVKCAKKKAGYVNSGLCNPVKCKDFEPLKLKT